MYDIRIVAILVANDNGSQAPSAAPAALTTSVTMANTVFNPHGVNFLFDPATDIYRINDDRLTRDCLRRDHQIYSDPNVEPGAAPEFQGEALGKYRNEFAQRFPGRIVVYFGPGSRYHWSEAEQRWVYGPRTYSWSNGSDDYVTMASWAVGGDSVAHEIGHYLHLGHVFWMLPGTVGEAVAAIKNYVEVQGGSKDDAVKALFDGDGIADTPPDPGPNVFTDPCDPAETSVTFNVNFADGSNRSYVVTPDRENIMSYWDKQCRGGVPRISAGQADVVRNALHNGNRRHLVEPAVLYHGVFEPGDRSQTRAIGWAQTDFASRFNNELAAGRRCVHMQAYPVAAGQIRWDGVWEPAGGVQQTRAIGWALQDFAKRFDDELKAGRRCVHMQGYDMGGGQVRYDGIWESGGDNGQSRAIGWAAEHFVGRWQNEVNGGKRCRHMQAYDIGGGQIRYDAVWEKAEGAQQTLGFALPIKEFAKRFDDELKAGRHCVHMQGYVVAGGQARYDGIWQSGGDNGQSRAIGWAFHHLIGRWDTEIAQGRRLVHLQAYDIGDGQIRYDAIWETSPVKQARVLALPLWTYADHFDELTSSGYHVAKMTACLRAYQSLPPAAGNIARAVSFGSDVDGSPARLAALPIPPLRERGSSCHLTT